MSPHRDCVVIGAGHNGLITACYLAAAGLDVEVVERDSVVGGAVSTVQRWPAHPDVRVDRGSSLHVMFRHTTIAAELDLAACGLTYLDADPFAVIPDTERGPLVLQCDLDATCEGIAAIAGKSAATGYRDFVDTWTPRWQAMLTLADATNPLEAARAVAPIVRREWRAGLELSRQFLTTAEAAVGAHVVDERLAASINWWAAQAGPAPHETGTAPIAGSIALMHLMPPGRAGGGSGALADALLRRLTASGGALRLGDGAAEIETSVTGNVRAIRTESGERITTSLVVAACHARTTLGLLHRPELAPRVRVGDGIGLVLRLLTDRPPSYDGDAAVADRAMTLLVRSNDQLRRAAADALAGEPSRDPPMLMMTPTLADPTLAPAGQHVVTVWSQWAPYRLASGDWDSRRATEAERLLAAAERWAPGLTSSVIERYVQTPIDLERELGLLNGDVMHVETGLDGIFGLRPLPGWSRRTPVTGLYLAGASTHPGGGVWGASGRAAARVMLSDRRRSHRRQVWRLRSGRPEAGDA